jgi:predicted alpha-1,6-mannanase (GH76 family)
MKNIFCFTFFLIVSLSFAATAVHGQTTTLSPGAIYTLRSKTNGKLLTVRNASTEDNAGINCWTGTGSDAQRWLLTSAGRNIYTLTNVATGKLLHVPGTDFENIDQAAAPKGENVKWIIKKAEKGWYYLQPANAGNYSLNPSGDTTNGAKVGLSLFRTAESQKWFLRREIPQAIAPNTVAADKIFEAWYKQYNIETAKGFWNVAEMMEVVLDAYEVTKDTRYINRFNTMYTNFIAHNKADWMYNLYNDDITWAVLFCVRGYLLTGNQTYLEKGKEQFDLMYNRASTNAYGGGLNWYETKTSKNACINGPAIVACCYLGQATGDKAYYDKAAALYTWSKLYLFNPATGKVNDNVDLDKKTGELKISTWSSTYNQGAYLAAAVMLYNYTKEGSYLEEAKRIARYTRDAMYNGSVMDNEDGGNDLPGFKGIFVRYARKYAIEGHQKDLNDWLLLNAKTAYNNRNSENIIQTKWGTQTSETLPRSDFGSSTAVSLLINTLFLQR